MGQNTEADHSPAHNLALVTSKEVDDPKEEKEGTIEDHPPEHQEAHHQQPEAKKQPEGAPAKIERKATMVAKASAQAKSSPKGE